MRPVVLLSLASLLSGCIIFPECGFTPQDATWTQPGLHKAMDALAAQGKASRQQEDGAPFNGSAFGLDGARLVYVALDAVELPSMARFSLDATGHVSVATSDDNPAARVRDWAVRFAGNVSALRGADLAAWAEGLVRNRTAGYEPLKWQYGALLQPIPLEALAAGLNATASPTQTGRAGSDSGDPGRIDLRAHGWTFTLSLPTWTATRGAARMEVDSFDHARYDESAGEMERPAYAQRINATLAALGLPPPAGPLEVSGYIC